MSEPSEIDGGTHEHCWHLSNQQHLISTTPGTWHQDDYCCRCGEARCQTVGTPIEQTGHGPFFRGGHGW